MSWPKALSLWSGYYASTLVMCAFARVSQPSQSAIEPFGNILFACTSSLLLGCAIGRKLAWRRPHMAQLTKILSLASAFALAPILLDDLARIDGRLFEEVAVDATQAAQFIASGLIIPPLTLLCMVPAYAAAIIARNRNAGGSSHGAVICWAALGFATGGLLNAHFMLNQLEAGNVLKINLAFSAIMILATMIQNPPRKVRVR